MRPALVGGLLALFSMGSLALAEDLTPEQTEFFEKHIRPLLVNRCIECHASEDGEPGGGLALDVRDGWVTSGDSGPAIVPGKPDESVLIEAVRYETYEMPPDGKLPQAEIDLLVKWVAMGAPDPRTESRAVVRHSIDIEAAKQEWPYTQAQRHDPPAVQNPSWALDPIDLHILAKLEANGMQPAPDADKRAWLRRVSFDLTGLPPTLDEIEAFLADDSPSAYARVVDRLLESPQFGEHWGRHWLDVARYADSNGGDFNATYHDAYRYRDYVIDTFNQDRPFDEFVRQQIAGDLLPSESDAERETNLVATGFLMIGPKMLSERDKEKLELDIVDEQIDTVGRVFLGLTLGCARCHDHKFDPVPTRDYYALAGVFGSTQVIDGEFQRYVSNWVRAKLPEPPEATEARAAYQEQLKKLKGQLAAAEKEAKEIESNAGKVSVRSLGVVLDDDQAEQVGQWTHSTYFPKFVGKGYLHDDNKDKGKKKLIFKTTLPETSEYEVRVAYNGGSSRAKDVPIALQHGDQTHEVKLDQTQNPKHGEIFQTIGRWEFSKDHQTVVTISNEGTSGYVIVDAVQFIPVALLDEESETPAEPDQELLAQAKQKVEDLKGKIKEFEKDAPPAAPEAMAARDKKKIEDCQLRVRGEVHIRGERVPRGFLQVLQDEQPALPEGESGRRELGEWIARADNPLTARVTVNRIWQNMLGDGIVRSVDNFGAQGEEPSHRELLDTLAVDFVEAGWRFKPMIRRIALSRTYRMATVYNEDAFLRDPDNRLLWTAPRKRLHAESIRDALLQISGKLDLEPAGPVVSHMGRYAVENNGDQQGVETTAGLKRSLYLAMVRGGMPEFLLAFDLPDPEMVVGRRSETNVPGQTLMLLNSPFVRGCAEGLADRLLEQKDLDDGARVSQMYQLALARPAEPHEIARALDYLRDSGENREGWARLAQALFASTEFRMID